MGHFLGERGLSPRDFWALTLPEIAAVVSPVQSTPTRRGDLARLMEAFPDGR
ncbi:MAG: phage tail assembly chaperone [Pseudomonadota bacterium]